MYDEAWHDLADVAAGVLEHQAPVLHDDGVKLLQARLDQRPPLGVRDEQRSLHAALSVPIALITAAPRSAIGKLAEVVVPVPAPTPKAGQVPAPSSIQPMGALFEQCLLRLFDAVVLRLMERKGIAARDDLI